ncbi:MAG: hypothetical protein ACRC35_12800 [Angustibacter sp.]
MTVERSGVLSAGRPARAASCAVVVPLLLVSVLAGCSETDDASGLSTFSGAVSSTTGATGQSSTGSPTSASAPATGRLPSVGRIVEGEVRAGSGEPRAVAAVWVDYWKFRAASYFAARVDAAALGRVATGSARSDVLEYVASLVAQRHRTVTDGRLDVSAVQVSGGSASISSCFRGVSVDVDADGRPVEQPSAQRGLRGVAVRQGPAWVVERITLDPVACRR